MEPVTAVSHSSTNRVREFRKRRKAGTYYLAKIPIDWQLLEMLRDNGFIELPTNMEHVSQVMLLLVKDYLTNYSFSALQDDSKNAQKTASVVPWVPQYHF